MRQSNFNPFNQQKPPGAGRPVAGTPLNTGKAQAKKKRDDVLNFMFNPELGRSFENLTEGHDHFVRLMANLFLQTGLIDATYPGFSDPKKLKLTILVQMAYQNLEFTREGLPRVLLFGAFIGSLVAVIASVLLFFLTVAAPMPQEMPAPPQVPPAQ